MTTYVIVVVNKTKLYPGIDPYIPKPAMGNMLPTTKGYDEKYQEKLDKIQMELVADPLFAYPTEVSIQFASIDAGSLTTGPVKNYSDKDLLTSAELRLHPQQRLEDYAVIGVNPYVDRSLITSYLVRNKTELPYWCNPSVDVFDVWKTMTGSNDWRTVAALWDLPKDPVDATLELLKRL